jgi:hypothetical protein
LDHYLDPTHSDYVGDDLANNWILIRFHSNDIGWGDPMYHAIGSPDYASNCDEDPVCYRFGGNSSSDAPYNPSFYPPCILMVWFLQLLKRSRQTPQLCVPRKPPLPCH